MKAFVGGNVYVDFKNQALRPGTVLTEGAKIMAVGAGHDLEVPRAAEVIDCSGLTITPGFWNSHVHFMERKWIDAAKTPAVELTQQFQDMLTRYGFTTAFDLSSPWENTRILRDRVKSREVLGPRILSTGLGLLPLNSQIPSQVVRFMGWMDRASAEVGTAEEARIATRQLLESGVDAVKLFLSAPSGATLSADTISAVVAEAHARGKPVFAHPDTGADIVRAVTSGVDIIAHTTPRGDSWDDLKLVNIMKEHQVALTPTLWIWKWYARHERRSVQDQIVKRSVGQLRDWAKAGGCILFGPDLGAVDPDPTEEYLLMEEAGMTFRDILAALTIAPAERFGHSADAGRISAGFDADLVILRTDPAADVRGFADVQYTVRAGDFIYRRN